MPAIERKLVFDPRIWDGRDRGDNSHCWVVADVLSVNADEGTATVRFPDGRISRGHFISAMREADLESRQSPANP